MNDSERATKNIRSCPKCGSKDFLSFVNEFDDITRKVLYFKCKDCKKQFD